MPHTFLFPLLLLSFFFLALSRYFLGEGNGTPLQYTCLENPWTEEPGRLQSMASLRVGHDWVTSVSLFTFMHWRRKWQPTLVFLPGESQGQRSLMGCCLWSLFDCYQIKKLIENNQSYTTWEIANILKICRSSVENYLHQFGYVNYFDVWVPYKLSKKKKNPSWPYFLLQFST